MFILAWFPVRLPLFSYDLKTIFVFWPQICYIIKIKSEKSTFVFNSPESKKPCRQKLLSDKQIKFKEFCVSWNKFHKNLPRDSFKIFFWKYEVLYEIYSKKSKVTNTYVHGL
jgi:hypothetical protein